MASTRNVLEEVSSNVDESMGRRRVDRSLALSPISSAKDVGRVPLRSFGKVKIDRVVPDPKQPRSEFDPAEIAQLAKSIRSKGQFHPIHVIWNEPINKWVIVSGERRWRATKHAGLPTVNCYFVERELTEAELREQQLVENLLRTNLKPIEEARGYQSLMDLNDWTGKQVAQALHVTTSRVSRALALLDLPTEVQEQIEEGRLSKSSAYEISKLENSEQQTMLADRASSGELSHAQTVNQIRKRAGKKSAKARGGVHQVFLSEGGLRVTVTAPTKVNYHEVELAISEALDEVRHRIRNNIKLM